MDMSPSPRLRWSDIWLLTALSYAAEVEPAPLTHIFAAADAINHDTPGYEEMSSGLYRLEHARLIVRVGEGLSFRCTPRALKLFAKVTSRGKSYYDVWKDLETLLDVAPWVPREPWPHPDNNLSYPLLTKDVFSQALKQYLKDYDFPKRKARKAAPSKRRATSGSTPSTTRPKRFSRTVLESIAGAKILGVRAGVDHRFTGIWVVVVKGRVFVRPWYDKPAGWHRAFLVERRGTIQVLTRQISVNARRVRGEALLDAIDEAYGEKYNTKASQKWVRGFRLARRRATTMEFLP